MSVLSPQGAAAMSTLLGPKAGKEFAGAGLKALPGSELNGKTPLGGGRLESGAVEAPALLGGWTTGLLQLEFGARVLGPLRRGPALPEALAQEAGIADGPLAVLLRVCSSLGYVSVDPRTGLCALAAACDDLQDLERLLQAVPSLTAVVRDVYLAAVPPFAVPSLESRQCLWAWEVLRLARRKVRSRQLLAALDGAVLLPLLASLVHSGRAGAAQEVFDFESVAPEDAAVLGEILEDSLHIGKMDDVGTFTTTPEGRQLLNAIKSESLHISSCSLALCRLAGAFQGSPPPEAPTLERLTDAQQSLAHTSRLVQAEALLPALTGVLDSVFGGDDAGSQPGALVVQLPWATAGLLGELLAHVKEHTPRSKLLGEHPLAVIGMPADWEEATAPAPRGVHVLPHDPPEPSQLFAELARADVDAASALHVRSCAGCLRRGEPLALCLSRQPAARAFAEAHLANTALEDRCGGRCAPLDVLASLVRQFESWGSVLGGSHGICLIEEAFLDKRGGATWGCMSAAQCLSGQHVVPAPVTALAAAMTGLLPRSVRSVCASRGAGGGCAFLGQHLARRNFRIRLAEVADLPRLLELEEASWAPEHRGSREVLLRRLTTSATTNLVCTKDGEVVAVLYMQRIDDTAVVDRQTIFEASEGHVPGGRFLQLIAIAADASCNGIGSELRAFALHLARLDPTIEGVFAVTLPRGFKNFDGSMQEYVDRHTHGQLFDPIIGFHTSFGAEVRRLVHGYRPRDVDNQGIGVLLEYNISSLEGTRASAQLPQADGRRAADRPRSTSGAAARTGPPAAEGAGRAGSDASDFDVRELVVGKIGRLGYEAGEEHLSRVFLDYGLDPRRAGGPSGRPRREAGPPPADDADVRLPLRAGARGGARPARKADRARAGACAPATRSLPQASSHTDSPQGTAVSMKELLATAVREIGFEVDEANLSRGFFDSGLDSVDVGSLKAAIDAKLNLALPATLIFDYPSVEALSGELNRLMGHGQQVGKAEVTERIQYTGDSKDAAVSGTPALSWANLACYEVEDIQRAQIEYFSQPAVQLRLRKKQHDCLGDKMRYLFGIDSVVDEGQAHVLQQFGLLEDAPSAQGLKQAQEKLLQAVMQFWCQGEVRSLEHQLHGLRNLGPARMSRPTAAERPSAAPEAQHRAGELRRKTMQTRRAMLRN